MVSFWTKLPTQWQASLELAWRGYVAGSEPIGAIVVDDKGTIMSTGAGHLLDNRKLNLKKILTSRKRFKSHYLVHAELHALLTFDGGDKLQPNYTLWTTLEPCPLCVGAICMSSVRKIRYACRDPLAGSIKLLAVSPFLASRNVQASGPDDLLLEAIIATLCTEFSIRQKGPGNNMVQCWRKLFPQAVDLAERLYAKKSLREKSEAGVSIAAVVDELADILC